MFNESIYREVNVKNTLNKIISWVVVLLFGLTTSGRAAETLDAAMQAKVDAKLKEIVVWAAAPEIVNAVKAHNASLPPAEAAMTQENWKSLSVMDLFVRHFTKNEAALFLKSKKDVVVSEAFISGADGLKVAFLSKPTNWSHKGKPKHEEPMAGKSWQGAVEMDDSSGSEQVQVSVPILDDGKVIGSLVVGLSLAKLK